MTTTEAPLLPFKIEAPTYSVVEDGAETTHVSRERQLGYGGTGSGKTRIWLDYLAATPDHVRFFVIDTDAAWEPARRSPRYNEFAHRVDVTVPDSWRDVAKATVRAMNEMGPRDWWVIDMAEPLWTMSQNFYHERKNPAAHRNTDSWLDAIVDGTLEDDEDTQKMWGKINQIYQPMREALKFCPGNIYVASTSKEMTDFTNSRDDKQIVQTYGGVKSKPGGQKNLGHDLNTIFLASKQGNGKRYLRLVKDREREHRWGEKEVIEHTNAAKDVLMTVCGWVPAREED